MTTRRRILVLSLLAAAALALSGSASASTTPTFADACGSANNLDYATCERLDYLASQSTLESDQLDQVWWGVWFVGGIIVVGLIVRPGWNRVFPWHEAPQ